MEGLDYRDYQSRYKEKSLKEYQRLKKKDKNKWIKSLKEKDREAEKNKSKGEKLKINSTKKECKKNSNVSNTHEQKPPQSVETIDKSRRQQLWAIQECR